MKLLVFGSTGSIGRQLVNQALEHGHTVTAFARDPSRLDIEHDKLTVVQGDVLDFPSVEKAMQGQDAVFCSLGAGSKGGVRSAGTENIVRAMEQSGIRRFICQSTLGVGDSWDNLNFFWKYIMFRGFLRQAYVDHVSQEDCVRKSRWTGRLSVRRPSRTDSAAANIVTAFRVRTRL